MERTAVPVAAETPPAEPELSPARPVDMRRAVQFGLLAGLGAIFVCSIGMVEAFDQTLVVGGLSFSYIMLMAFPLGIAYLAGRPPPQLEGFAASRPGLRNVLAGLLTGLLAGGVAALYLTLVGNVDVRSMFINISPRMIEILSFGRGLLTGSLLLVAAGAALGAAGGALQLVPERWRRALTWAVVWVVVFGLMESLIQQLLRGMELESLIGPLYEGTGALAPLGAVVVAVVVLTLSLVLQAKGKPLVAAARQVRAKKQRGVMMGALAVVIVFLAILPQILGPFLSEVLNIAGIFLLMALGLNIVVGLAGLLDLGYVAFFAVGAYGTAVLTSSASPSFSPELSFWLALPIVVLGAAVAGLLVGVPVLRMRGDYLAIVTLGFGEIARLLFLSDWFKPVFGGAQGIIRIPEISIGPITIEGPQAFFYPLFAFVLIAAYVSYAVQDSRMGRAWMAMREDESVAEAMGVNIVTAKLAAFIIGAVLAGFGGALFGTKIGSVFPSSFDVVVSITVLVVIIVGGMASIPGVVVGALVLIALPELLREFEQFRYLLYGALLIVMMLKRPEGFIPSRRRALELHGEELSQDEWLREEQERAGADAAPATT